MSDLHWAFGIPLSETEQFLPLSDFTSDSGVLTGPLSPGVSFEVYRPQHMISASLDALFDIFAEDKQTPGGVDQVASSASSSSLSSSSSEDAHGGDADDDDFRPRRPFVSAPGSKRPPARQKRLCVSRPLRPTLSLSSASTSTASRAASPLGGDILEAGARTAGARRGRPPKHANSPTELPAAQPVPSIAVGGIAAKTARKRSRKVAAEADNVTEGVSNADVQDEKESDDDTDDDQGCDQWSSEAGGLPSLEEMMVRLIPRKRGAKTRGPNMRHESAEAAGLGAREHNRINAAKTREKRKLVHLVVRQELATLMQDLVEDQSSMIGAGGSDDDDDGGSGRSQDDWEQVIFSPRVPLSPLLSRLKAMHILMSKIFRGSRTKW